MFGARVVAFANSEGASAANADVEQALGVARASETPRRWWQRLFATGGGTDRPAIVAREAAAVRAEAGELRPRPMLRLDPARGVVE